MSTSAAPFLLSAAAPPDRTRCAMDVVTMPAIAARSGPAAPAARVVTAATSRSCAWVCAVSWDMSCATVAACDADVKAPGCCKMF